MVECQVPADDLRAGSRQSTESRIPGTQVNFHFRTSGLLSRQVMKSVINMERTRWVQGPKIKYSGNGHLSGA